MCRFAGADPQTADEWYSEGNTQYTLGNFDKAIDAFKKGFEVETSEAKKPAYLYNIAQSYRQANDCEHAVFFYKRFLASKVNDTIKPLAPALKAEVEGHIADGEQCMKQQQTVRNKAPQTTMPLPANGQPRPDASSTTATPTQTAAAEPVHPPTQADQTPETNPSANAAPHLLAVRIVGGGSKIGAGNLSIPVQATGTLLVGYPLALGDKLGLEVGAGASITPVPYDTSAGQESAKMTSVFANVGARYMVAPSISVGGEVGAGVLLLSGVDDGNPFTATGAGTTGALTMFHARVAASADYLVTQNVIVTLTPIAFSYSPAKSGLRSDISAFTGIDFMLGIGYRM